MRAVLRLGLRRIGGALADHPRYYADRGLLRKDYTDAGFQTNGYINENWFSSTQEGKRRSPRVPRLPVFCGSREDEDEFQKRMKKERKMGDCRRRFEEESGNFKEKEVRETMQAPEVQFEDEIIPELDLLPAPPTYKKKAEKQRMKRRKKVLFKSRVIIGGNYEGFRYRGSGLDDYSRKLEKEEKRRRHQSELNQEDVLD